MMTYLIIDAENVRNVDANLDDVWEVCDGQLEL